jgi:hypothetical protein
MSEVITRLEAETRLITRAWKDKTFCEQLLKDPKATVEKELGVKFEEDAEVVVLQETPYSWHIILPLGPEHFPEKYKESVVVRDKAGNFYNMPVRSLLHFAIRDAEAVKAAGTYWESDMVAGEWTTECRAQECVCGVRGIGRF